MKPNINARANIIFYINMLNAIKVKKLKNTKPNKE